MNIRPNTVIAHSKPAQQAPQFAARYRLNGEAVSGVTGATGTTVSFAPEFVLPVLNASGLASWGPAMMANPAMAGLITSLGGNVTAQVGGNMLIKTPDRSPNEPKEVTPATQSETTPAATEPESK